MAQENGPTGAGSLWFGLPGLSRAWRMWPLNRAPCTPQWMKAVPAIVSAWSPSRSPSTRSPTPQRASPASWLTNIPSFLRRACSPAQPEDAVAASPSTPDLELGLGGDGTERSATVSAQLLAVHQFARASVAAATLDYTQSPAVFARSLCPSTAISLAPLTRADARDDDGLKDNDLAADDDESAGRRLLVEHLVADENVADENVADARSVDATTAGDEFNAGDCYFGGSDFVERDDVIYPENYLLGEHYSDTESEVESRTELDLDFEFEEYEETDVARPATDVVVSPWAGELLDNARAPDMATTQDSAPRYASAYMSQPSVAAPVPGMTTTAGMMTAAAAPSVAALHAAAAAHTHAPLHAHAHAAHAHSHAAAALHAHSVAQLHAPPVVAALPSLQPPPQSVAAAATANTRAHYLALPPRAPLVASPSTAARRLSLASTCASSTHPRLSASAVAPNPTVVNPPVINPPVLNPPVPVVHPPVVHPLVVNPPVGNTPVSTPPPEDAFVGRLVKEQFISLCSSHLDTMAHYHESFVALPSHALPESLFFSVSKPKIATSDYIRRLVNFTQCSDSAFVLMLVYLDRAAASNKTLALTPCNMHRLLVSSLTLAAKILDDRCFSNVHYAKVGGIPTVKEMNRLEVQFLHYLDFALHVPVQEYEHRVLVLETAAAPKSPRSILSMQLFDSAPNSPAPVSPSPPTSAHAVSHGYVHTHPQSSQQQAQAHVSVHHAHSCRNAPAGQPPHVAYGTANMQSLLSAPPPAPPPPLVDSNANVSLSPVALSDRFTPAIYRTQTGAQPQTTAFSQLAHRSTQKGLTTLEQHHSTLAYPQHTATPTALYRKVVAVHGSSARTPLASAPRSHVYSSVSSATQSVQSVPSAHGLVSHGHRHQHSGSSASAHQHTLSRVPMHGAPANMSAYSASTALTASQQQAQHAQHVQHAHNVQQSSWSGAGIQRDVFPTVALDPYFASCTSTM